MVFAISSAAGEYLPMTMPVDRAIHFLKPALRSDLLAQARVVRLGRTMAFGSVSIETASDTKPVALAQTPPMRSCATASDPDLIIIDGDALEHRMRLTGEHEARASSSHGSSE